MLFLLVTYANWFYTISHHLRPGFDFHKLFLEYQLPHYWSQRHRQHAIGALATSYVIQIGNLRVIWTTEYNSKFKYKYSNLRLKHYLHYKVKWKETNKSFNTCYFGLRILYMQSLLQLYNILDWIFFIMMSQTLIKYHSTPSFTITENHEKCVHPPTSKEWRNYWMASIAFSIGYYY